MGRRVGWGTKSASEACPEVLETWKASCTGVGPLQGLADLKGSCPVWMEFMGIKKKGHFSIFGFDYLMRRADSLEKTLMLGKIESRKRRG